MDAFGYTGLQLASSRGTLYLLENIKLPYMFKRDLLMKGDMAVLKYSSNIKWVPKQKYSQEVDHDGIIKLLLEFGCSSEIPCWTKTTQSALDTTRDFYPNGAVPLLIQKSKLNWGFILSYCLFDCNPQILFSYGFRSWRWWFFVPGRSRTIKCVLFHSFVIYL